MNNCSYIVYYQSVILSTFYFRCRDIKAWQKAGRKKKRISANKSKINFIMYMLKATSRNVFRTDRFIYDTAEA